jgi:Tol biopolymer transport system component
MRAPCRPDGLRTALFCVRLNRRRFCAASIPAIFSASLQAQANGVSVRRIWAGPDTNLFGSPSLDGHFLSFVDTESGDLAIRDLASGEKRRLTGSGDVRQFAYFSILSPDSRLAAYAWFNEEKFYDLRVIGLDGSGRRTLFRNEEAGFVQPCAWSPDSKQILTLFFRKDNSSQIALVPAGGGPARVLKSLNWVYPRKMDFSPDGRYIVYDESGNEDAPTSSLRVLAADGSRETALVNDAGANLFPVWMRDGTRVLFASDRDGAMGLWSIAVREGKPAGAPQPVRRNLGRFLPMAITASGDYYYGLRAGDSQVYMADLEAERITEVPMLKSSSAPEWSPDGQRLAVLTRVGAENFGQESRVISIVSLESGKSRVIAPKLAYLERIRWSPDGQELLASGSDRGARRGLFRISVETGATSPVIREGASTYRGLEGVWADGGKAILYIHENTIRLRDLASNVERQLYRGPNLHELALSSDGQWLAFVATSPEKDELMAMRVTGNETRQLSSVPKGGISGVEWARDNSHLLVSTPSKPVAGLWRVSLAGGQPERLPIALDRQGGVRIHPDGRRIAFTRGAIQSEVWKMDLTSLLAPIR